MKTLKQNQTDNHQKEGSKREDKKKTNIKFNSAIFFQLGLVVALVVSAWAMNLKIGERTPVIKQDDGYTVVEPPFKDYRIEQKVVPVKQPVAKLTPPPVQRVVTSKFKEVSNDIKTPETKIVAPTTTTVVPTPPVVKPPVTPTPPVDNGPKNMISVEFAPIYPGCESAGDKNAMIACMSDKIGRFVGRKFDTSVAGYDAEDVQKIYVQFKIDKNGKVADIIARAPDKNLEKEAQRVISRLPEFTPGRMGDVAVDVMYMLPITFRLN